MNDGINRADLLNEAKKSTQILNTLKETLLPLISSDDTKNLIESIKAENNVLLEKKDQQITVLKEELDKQVQELTFMTEEFGKYTEESETLINEERAKRLLVEDKLVQAETKTYAYETLRENFRLRNYTPQLLECKSKFEVDRLVETILTLVKSNPSTPLVESRDELSKSLTIPEAIDKHLKKNGQPIAESSEEDDDEWNAEELEQAKLAGISPLKE